MQSVSEGRPDKNAGDCGELYRLTNAIAESTLRRDGNGNPAIDKARSAGRIDVLSAAVLAVGEAALCPVRCRCRLGFAAL